MQATLAADSPTLAHLDLQLTEALAARQWYMTLFTDAPWPLLVTNQWGHIDEANQAAVAFFNIHPLWLVRKPLVVFVPLRERSGFRMYLQYLGSGQCLPEWKGHLQPRGCPPLPVTLAARVVPLPHAFRPSLVWRVRETPC